MRARSMLLLVLPCLGIELLLVGCGASVNSGQPSVTPTNTTMIAPTVTPTVAPRPTTTYTCTARSLPVGQGYTQTSCAITTEGNYHILRASYTGQNNNYFVNEQRLVADGWFLIQQEHGDSPYGAIGDAIYTSAGAWFSFHYDYPTGKYSIEQGIPVNPQSTGNCGQTIKAGTADRMGIPLPANSLTPDNGPYIIVPACPNDLQTFYSTVLPPTGSTIAQPFQTENTSPPLVASFVVVSHGNTNLHIALGSSGNILTIIAIASYG